MRKSVDQERLKKFGRHLAQVRKNLGITQEELALESGLSLSQIARIETGVINTSIDTLFIISKTLKIAPEAIFKGLVI